MFVRKHIFIQLNKKKSQIKDEESEEKAGKPKLLTHTYCFFKHVIGQTLLALKLWITDLKPSIHFCKKIKKTRLTGAKLADLMWRTLKNKLCVKK